LREKYPQNKQLPPNQAEPNAYLQDKRSKGWFWDFNEVFDSDLSKNAILVRLYIAKCANGDRQAWPSLKKIVKNCKISKPTVTKALGELEEKKWLKKIIQKRPNSEYANTIYILNNPPVSLPKEGGSKIALPPVKNKEGVVNSFNHLVKPLDNLVKPLDPNKTQITIPNKEKDKLFISSLRSDTNNSAVDLQSTAAVDSNNLQKHSKCDSHMQTGVVNTKDHCGNDSDSRPQAGAADQDRLPSAKDLITELTGEYRSTGAVPKNGDFAFIGSLYNRHGYEKVLEGIHELSMAMAAEEISKPLLYLKSIVEGVKRGSKTTKAKLEKDEQKDFFRSLYMG